MRMVDRVMVVLGVPFVQEAGDYRYRHAGWAFGDLDVVVTGRPGDWVADIHIHGSTALFFDAYGRSHRSPDNAVKAALFRIGRLHQHA